MIASTRQELASLDVQRKALEQEAAAITNELTSPTGEDLTGPPIGVDTPLVDGDGYPRADIDVYRARSLRSRLAEIRTDHTQLMKRVDSLLQQLARLVREEKQRGEEKNGEEEQARMASKPKPKYDPVSGKWVVKNWDGTIAGAGNGDGQRTFDSIGSATPPVAQLSNMALSQEEQQQQPNGNGNVVPTVPFARVDSVAPRSPAADAGLQEGDEILRFGSVTKDSSADPFHEVAQLVPSAAGQRQAIAIVVVRRESSSFENNNNNNESTTANNRTLQLTPRPWDGRGLLGCHIVPI